MSHPIVFSVYLFCILRMKSKYGTGKFPVSENSVSQRIKLPVLVKTSRMKRVIFSFSMMILFILPVMLVAQEAVKILDGAYGLDQTLYNGKKYLYSPPPGTKGDQYLVSSLYSDGSVTLKGKCFHDVALNYDVFNQELLLLYADKNFPRNIIEVSKGWLTGFSLGSMNFELLSLEQEPRFYQVLGEDTVRILYFWRKNLGLNDVIGTANFVFTPPVRDSFVFMDGKLNAFWTKKSLIRIFEPQLRPQIKNYLRKNRVNVKKASDQAMTELIRFINKIR
jgi:hypothetical protein